jgi:hypothetical protein
MKDKMKVFFVTAQAVHEVVTFLCAGNSAEEVEFDIRGEFGDTLVPINIARYGAWMPDGSGGEFWAYAQNFSFDDEVAAAWAAEGRSYPG